MHRIVAYFCCSPQITESDGDLSIFPSSHWFHRQTSGSGVDGFNYNTKNVLSKELRQLDSEYMKLVGIEQQIQSIGMKCQSICENITTKTNSINLILNDMFANSKQSAQKQTQTDIEDIKTSFGKNDSVSEIMNKSLKNNLSRFELKEMANNLCISEFSDNRKNGLNRLPALVKGYLTRRLMKTSKVLHYIEAIREIKLFLDRQQPAEDVVFQRRLETQLAKTRKKLFDILFNYPKAAQMALISQLRQHIRALHFRIGLPISTQSYLSSNSRLNGSTNQRLSSVTRKVIERRRHRN